MLTKVSRPALRYYGSKWRIAQWIIEHLPPHTCYVEPYGGSASVLIQKPISKFEVLNDLDGEVINFFEMLRARPDDLVRAIELTPYARAEYNHSFEPCQDPLERARRFYVRSQQGWNGRHHLRYSGWRFQRAESKGASVMKLWNRADHLEAIAQRLKNVQVECDDALSVIQRFDALGTLFYCDPPYLSSTRSERYAKTAYVHEMSDDDHRRLADVLHGIRGMVVISGYPSLLYDELYAGWQVVTRRTITDAKTQATECLWISPAAQQQRRLL